MFFKFFILCCFVSVVFSATWREKLSIKPAKLHHKEGCYVKGLDDVIPYGEELTPKGTCVRIECTKRFIYYSSCAAQSAEPPCYMTQPNVELSYPECCPVPKCDNEDDYRINNFLTDN